MKQLSSVTNNPYFSAKNNSSTHANWLLGFGFRTIARRKFLDRPGPAINSNAFSFFCFILAITSDKSQTKRSSFHSSLMSAMNQSSKALFKAVLKVNAIVGR